jgi:hypothetical protein
MADQGQTESKAKSPGTVSGKPRSRFSNTLGEQLKSKDLNLLAGDNQEKNDE